MNTLLQLHNKAVAKSLRQRPRRPRSSRPEAATSDFRCDGCGYQIAIAQPHPVCPMCGLGSWTAVSRSENTLTGGHQADR